jgi:hypothetical protein
MNHVDPSKSSSSSPPRKIKRAFHGLAGSPLAVVQREVESLATHPIQFDAAALFDGGTINLPPLDKKALRKIALAVTRGVDAGGQR